MIVFFDITTAEQLHHVCIVGIAPVALTDLRRSVPTFDKIRDGAVTRLNIGGHVPLRRGAHGIAHGAAVETAEHLTVQKRIFNLGHSILHSI